MPESGRHRRGTLVVSGDGDADALINTDPLALMIAMLLDQQVPIEWAFASPLRLAQRLGGVLDAAEIAAMDPEELVAVAAAKPAIHRFPAMMARRIHKLCEHLVVEYQGNAASIWADANDADVLYDRLLAVPGYGPVKSQILIAVLAKRFGFRPDGWEAVAGVFATEDLRSVADLDDPTALGRLREKRQPDSQ
ncbi:MAG: Fe-S cluster assembly protein HesB [Acidimicrobiaceae bacterium]|nr:Fe-S cluster assembly protein HesB [Acidimicrobiaceae bacterium]